MNDIILLFLTVPLITSLIGWVTNWAAVKMIFYPERFVGLGPLGWQGILFKQNRKLATGIADMAISNLITAEELAGRIDPAELQKRIEPAIEGETEKLAEEVGDMVMPGAWANLPPHVKEMVMTQLKTRSLAISTELFEELRGRADEFVDLHGLVVDKLTEGNASVLADLTKKIGHKEFKFIEYYGAVFGLVIGLAQIGIWSAMEVWWLMPVVGVIVGLVTNWLAIQMIFRPQEPKKYFGLVTYQGLFPKRQAEISADYGESASTHLLNADNFIELVTSGEAGQQLQELVETKLDERVEKEWHQIAPMVPVDIDDDKKAAIKAHLRKRLGDIIVKAEQPLKEYLEESFDIERTVKERLATMPKDKFERILRGVFEEDEITLILVGGFLGFAVGCGQAALVMAL